MAWWRVSVSACGVWRVACGVIGMGMEPEYTGQAHKLYDLYRTWKCIVCTESTMHANIAHMRI